MSNPHEGRPPHPQYGKPLSGKPSVHAGITFRPYRRGIGLYVRVSDDFRICVYDHFQSGSTYTATVDGVGVDGGKRFRSQTRCFEAAVAQARRGQTA